MRGGMFYLEQHAPAGRSVPRPHERRASASRIPATFFDASNATTAARPLHRRPGRHDGAVLVRRAERHASTSASSGPGRSATRSAGTTASHALRIGGEFRRNEFDTNLPEEQATEFEKFDNFTQLLRGLATEADTQFGITDKQFRFNDFNMFLADDWRLSPIADAEPRRALRVLRAARGGQRPDRQRRLRGADEHREPGRTRSSCRRTCRTTGFAAIDGAIAASVEGRRTTTR